LKKLDFSVIITASPTAEVKTMKFPIPDPRGSNQRAFRAISLGSIAMVLTLFILFQLNGQLVSADSSLMTLTGMDPLFTKAAKLGNKIAPEVLADTSDGRRASVVIFLADQADVSGAHKMKDQDARGWYVYNTLTEHAARTQADLKGLLTARGVEFRSFWAANMLVATVDRAQAEEIAARSDVARVDSNRPAYWIEDPALADFHESSSRGEAPDVVEPGLTNVNAPAVWAMGFTGQNMVIGNQDTGIRWTHDAIKPKYRGWNGTTADHNFNWRDAIHSGGGSCGPDTVAPCDDHGHGTHTTGTTVGDDGNGNQVGVAPGAKWIGCRNMDVGNGTPATYTECFQFFIAPTDLAGNNANPALRPHSMNNSWGCPPSEGCNTGAELETIVNNAQAAGIFVAVSAGNSGSNCSTVSDPPAIYDASFSVGSISPTSNNLSGFSSRGPSLFYTPNLLKPNIVAPGSNIRSSTSGSDTSYGNMSGTSMAGPHVAGVVALLWSARPALVRDIAATKTLLQNTANPDVNITAGTQTCGGIPSTQIPNNSFGYGRVDVLAAVNAAGTSTPTNTPTNTPTATPTSSAVINGTITYGNAVGAPPAPRFVSNVLVSGAGSPPVSAITNAAGTYSLSGFGPGSYTITPSRSGGQNGAITSFDAGRISQHVVGGAVLTPAQLTVADVSGAGGISSFDAALVARYAVSAPNSGMSGDWIFSPSSNTLPSVSGTITEDYTALLMGDVSGSWAEGSRPVRTTRGPESSIVVEAAKVDVQAGSEIILPVTVKGLADKGTISYECDLRYDPSVLSPQVGPVAVSGTVSSGRWVVAASPKPGLLKIVVYGPLPIKNDGVLFNLRFNFVGKSELSSPLTLERFVFDDGDDATVLLDGGVNVADTNMNRSKLERALFSRSDLLAIQ